MRTRPLLSLRPGKNFLRFSALLTISFIVLLTSCKKDSTDTDAEGKASLSIRMTDAPADYDAVLIDIQGVEITGTAGGTVTLNTNAGIYNLLDFANGIDTLIAYGDLEAGTVSQIRLILGNNNSVVINGESHPLATPSASESGLKIQVHKTFEPGVAYSILLDFDAGCSIVEKGNGEYLLKPVIRTIDEMISGAIRGSITPVGSIASITITSSSLVATTVVNAQGKFVIKGLPEGIYDVTVTPKLPLLPVTVTGVTVSAGVTTDLGIIPL